jgi:hypothetical protein
VFWEVVALLCVLAGSHYYLWRYSFNEGLVQGAEVALDELEKEELIKVDGSGKIWQWDEYRKQRNKRE